MLPAGWFNYGLCSAGGNSAFSLHMSHISHNNNQSVDRLYGKDRTKNESTREFGYYYVYLLSNLFSHSHVYGLNRPRVREMQLLKTKQKNP